MRIVFGCDHRGLSLKQTLIKHATHIGHKTDDVGCYDPSPVDYPDIAQKVAESISTGKADRGILICSTGTGMSIAANKMRGIRAALCHNTSTAHMARQHNNANVLCLGEDVIGTSLANEIVSTFLDSEFDGGKHVCRLDKISAMENIQGEEGNKI